MATATKTALFPWKEDYSVHMEPIDTQHKRLVQLINDLHDAMLTRKTREETGRIIAELVKYTQFHFSDEERLMHQHNYKDLADHKAEHAAFAAKVAKFSDDYKEGSPVLNIGLMGFLKEWLKEHIMVSDHKYASSVHGEAGVHGKAGA